MRFHYAGKYSGNEKDLPQREHEKNAVAFKEPDIKKLSVIANVGAVVLTIVLAIPVIVLGRHYFGPSMILASILGVLALVPHELLHAVWFKEDVYLYTHLDRGLVFVVGAEDMSKLRFIIMSLCPATALGFIPYILFLIHPQWIFLGLFGLICITQGFADYLNVYHALRQMPWNARTYLYGIHSYWYIPEEQ